MIIKSYIVEQNIDILKEYKGTLIYGENIGIKDDIKEKIIEKNKNCEIINFFEINILKNNLLHESIANQSLFTEKKIIFIQEASDKIFDKVIECLEKKNNDIKIYIIADSLEKKSKLRAYFEKEKNLAIFPCYEDSEKTLLYYVSKELKNFKGITGEITNLIIQNSNMNRRIIKSEITKIKDFFLKKEINKEQILEILNVKNNSDFDKLRDKALMGEKSKINKLLSETEILRDEALFYLNNLNYRVMRLYEIIKVHRINNDYDYTLDNLRPPIFWKDKPIIREQLKKWNQKKIESMLLRIAETEILIKKNSNLNSDVIIKDLLISVTDQASTSY